MLVLSIEIKDAHFSYSVVFPLLFDWIVVEITQFVLVVLVNALNRKLWVDRVSFDFLTTYNLLLHPSESVDFIDQVLFAILDIILLTSQTGQIPLRIVAQFLINTKSTDINSSSGDKIGRDKIFTFLARRTNFEGVEFHQDKGCLLQINIETLKHRVDDLLNTLR